MQKKERVEERWSQGPCIPQPCSRARACYRPRFSPTTFKIEDEHEHDNEDDLGEDNQEGKMDRWILLQDD